ncbi:MAG TPA: ABC transporter permease, partial [Actinophytocola sp.]|nr:ABC transporter permease [Actinophytocola sp.]
MTALRAELFATRRRPGVWVVGGVWLGLTIVFGMAVPYIVYLAISGSADPQGDPAKLLATLLPDRLVPTTLSLFPLFGSAIMLIMGAVLAGGEFRWGTWGTLLTQGPSRTAVVLGKLGALAVALAGVAVATFVTVGAIGAVLAAVEGKSMAWPDAGRIAAGLGCAWLV